MRATIRTLAVASALAAAASIVPARAQTTPIPPIPPANCEKPSDYVPLAGAGSAEMTRVQRRVDAYKKCVNDYAQVNNAQAQSLAEQSKAYQDAANKAIEEYNAFVNDLNARANKPQ